MMRQRLILVAALSLGLVGCTLRPTSLVSLPTIAGAPETPQATSVSAPEAPVTAFGTLQLTVRWPERPEGYQTALLPTSTNTLLVKVSSGSTVVGQTTVSREPNQTTATAYLPLPADNNLSVEVTAYREMEPLPADAEPIAQGTRNVNITRSKKTSASVTLTPLLIPTITGLSRNAGVTGDEVTITGTNFGSGNIPVLVSFNGYLTVGATRSSETSLTVQVPPGAPTGKVVVKADGVSSTSDFVFWVPKTVSLNTTYDFWDPSEPGKAQIVLLGKSKQLTATTTWETKLGETAEQYGTPPTPTWSSSDTTAGTVDSTGKFTAGNAYKAAGTDVRASHGSFSSAAFKLIPEAVSFSLGVPSERVLGGKGKNYLTFAGVNAFSDGSTNSYVTYTAASASIDWLTGRAIATDFGSNGTITVSAESQVDPDQKTTTDITLSNFTVTTVVGDGNSGSRDGLGTLARFTQPRGLGFDPSGNLYVADWGLLRRVTPTWDVTTAIGGGNGQHESVCVAADGTLYVSDLSFHVIRQIKDGTSTILAGEEGSAGFADLVGADARFNTPAGLALDGQGNLLVADSGNHRIRKIDLATKAVSTLAGSTSGWLEGTGTGAMFSSPQGIAVDASGNLYVADNGNHRVRKVTSAGVVSTLAGTTIGFQDGLGSAAKFCNPMGIAVDPDDNVYVTDFYNHRIRKIAPDGWVSTVAGFGPAMNFGGGSFQDGIGIHAGFKEPIGIAIRDGRLYVVERGNYTLRLLQ